MFLSDSDLFSCKSSITARESKPKYRSFSLTKLTTIVRFDFIRRFKVKRTSVKVSSINSKDYVIQYNIIYVRIYITVIVFYGKYANAKESESKEKLKQHQNNKLSLSFSIHRAKIEVWHI